MFFRRKTAPPSVPTDAELLARYRRLGDVADLGALYERHLPAVFATCRRYLRLDEDVEVLRMLAEGPAWVPGVAASRRALLPVQVKVLF